MSEEEEIDDGFRYGLRRQRIYNITESELNMLWWLPWFARRRMIRRIKEETAFDDE